MDFDCKKDIPKVYVEPSVSVVAQDESHITAPVLASNTITGDIHIYNASGNTRYDPDSEKTQPSAINSVIVQYKQLICSEYQHVTEYNSLPGEHVLLCQRYTEPLIVQKYRDQSEREEEICSKGESFQQVLSARSSYESVLNSLFHPDDHEVTPRAVILQGNSGNGKSFAVQKIMMDWASENLYKEQFDILFHLKCKEINCISDEKSLVDLLSWSSGLTSDQISRMLQQSPEKVLFLIDGFDEFRLTQDMNHVIPPTDPHQRCKPELTLCALLKGHLQPRSFLLVTTRSTATDTLRGLLKNPQRFTEIMGFSEKGVEEYFQKFFQDDELFRKAYTFVKANETLFTACSVPVICWIICTVIRERFNHGANVTNNLETTTSIYVDFVFTLLDHHCQGLSESVPTLMRSLGQLAERGMMENQVLFDVKTVSETVKDPDGCPFLCKFLFKKRIQRETMFSFMHLSFQEFFTGLYYVSLDEDQSLMKLSQLCSSLNLFIEQRSADVLKFAFGLANKDLQRRLRKHGLFVHENAQAHLKAWLLNEIKCPYNLITPYLIHLLYEIHDKSFAEETLKTWDFIFLCDAHMRRSDCWHLLYCAQCCDSMRRMVLTDLKVTSERFSMILPVLHTVEKLELTLNNPTDSDVVDLMWALTQTTKPKCIDVFKNFCSTYENCSIRSLHWSFSNELFSIRIRFPISAVVWSLCLTLPCSQPIDWTKFFQIFPNMDLDALTSVIQSLSKVKGVELSADCLHAGLCVWAPSISQNCSSLTELKIDAGFLQEEGIRILQKSKTRPDCTMTFQGLRCNKQSQKCTLLKDSQLNCNQMVKISVSCQGFAEETLEKSVFWEFLLKPDN